MLGETAGCRGLEGVWGWCDTHPLSKAICPALRKTSYSKYKFSNSLVNCPPNSQKCGNMKSTTGALKQNVT